MTDEKVLDLTLDNPTYDGIYLWEDPIQDASKRNGILLSDQIDYFINSCGLIVPYNKDSLRPAYYTLHVGSEYYKNGKSYQLKEGQNLSIEPNELVYIKSYEYLNIPYYIIARYSLGVTEVYRGLVLDNGLHIDPGYHGHINVPIYNFTNEKKSFQFMSKLLSIEFIRTTPFELECLTNSKLERECDWINENLRSEIGPIKLFKSNPKKLYTNRKIRDYFTDEEENRSALIEVHEKITNFQVQFELFEKNIIEKYNKFESSINQKTKRQSKTIAASVIAILIGIFGPTWFFIWDCYKIGANNSADLTKIEKETNSIKYDVDNLIEFNRKLTLTEDIRKCLLRLDSIENKIKSLEIDINTIKNTPKKK